MTQITPYQLWLDFKTWVNTQQGGFMPPQSIFIRAANIASLELWKRWTKEAEKSQEIKDNLQPFLVSKNIITTQANSYYSTFLPPENYGRFATAKILLTKGEKKTVPDIQVDKGKCCKGTKINVTFKPESDLAEDYYNNTIEADVTIIDNQKWSAVLKHLTKFPTFENPKMTQINKGFKIAPREVSVVVLNYYTEPIDAVFGYKPVVGNIQTGSGGAIVYDPLTSVKFQWGKQVKPDLLEELKKVYIGFTRSTEFQQISASQKQTQP